MWLKRISLLMWILTLGSCGAVAPGMAMSGQRAVRCESGHKPTNPPEIAKWFESLHNRGQHPCCAEGDGYPAEIIEEAAPGHAGRGRILDGSAKEIWSQDGCLTKTRPEIGTGQEFTFTWAEMVPETYGNPTKTAIVFAYPSWDNGQWKVGGIHCIVPLPPSF